MEERLKAEAEEDELDKLAAQLIMQETREAHKRAEKEGVLAYLGMASTSTSLLDQWQALHPGQRLAATSSASARAKKKVPDKVFLQNLLSHTVGSNELQRRQEDWYERESMERRRKQRARKDKEARNPRKRRRKEEEEEEEESEREEKEEGENKYDESAAAPMIGPKFKRVKGRGSFAYMRGGSERMKSIFAASNKEEGEEAESEATPSSPFVIRDEKLERWKEEERQRRRTEERARSTEEQKKENKKKEIKGKKEKKKRRKDRKEKRKKRKKEKKKEKRRDYSDSS